MRLRTLDPPAAIAPFVHHAWIFESATGLPEGDLRVVVPNGRPKLIVPWRGGLTAEGGGLRFEGREGSPVLIGLWEEPAVLSSARAPTATVGIEFTPAGLHRFLPADLHELSGAIVPVADALGRAGAAFAGEVQAAGSADAAADATLRFLLGRLGTGGGAMPSLVEHALRLMAGSGFRLEMAELERRMGYSRRHLSALFRREAGLPPSRLQAILAFERLYRTFGQGRSVRDLRSDALDLFCDESHFSRHFRRFTGLPPGRFAEAGNEFGLIFYRAPGG